MPLKDIRKPDEVSKQLQGKPHQIDHVTRPPKNLGQQSPPSGSLTQHRRAYAQAVKDGPINTTLHSEEQSSSGPASKVDRGPLPDEPTRFFQIGGIYAPSLLYLRTELSSGRRIGVHSMPSEMTSDSLERDQKATQDRDTIEIKKEEKNHNDFESTRRIFDQHKSHLDELCYRLSNLVINLENYRGKVFQLQNTTDSLFEGFISRLNTSDLQEDIETQPNANPIRELALQEVFDAQNKVFYHMLLTNQMVRKELKTIESKFGNLDHFFQAANQFSEVTDESAIQRDTYGYERLSREGNTKEEITTISIYGIKLDDNYKRKKSYENKNDFISIKKDNWKRFTANCTLVTGAERHSSIYLNNIYLIFQSQSLPETKEVPPPTAAHQLIDLDSHTKSPSQRPTHLRQGISYASAAARAFQDQRAAQDRDTVSHSCLLSKDFSPIVTDKRDASDNEVDHTELFKDFLKEPQKNRTIERIVALIPKDAVGYHLDSKAHRPSMIGFEYRWTDLKDMAARLLYRREWTVRIHEPNPCDPVGRPTDGRWALRIGLGNQYMDIHGQFHHFDEAYKGGKSYDRKIADDTHIPIQTPDSYISPIDNPEHYGRKK